MTQTTSRGAHAGSEKGVSPWLEAWFRLKKNRAALFGAVILMVLSVLAVCAPLIAPYGYADQDIRQGAIAPDEKHWFGTDPLGRDLFTRVLYGGRISLMVGLSATLVSVVIGIAYGAISGYVGGRVDTVMMRFVDGAYAFPFTIFVIVLMVLFGRNLILLFCAIGAVEWLTMARIVRGQVLSVKKQEYVESAIALGLPRWVVILRHIVPNVTGPVIVYTTLTIPSVMLLEAFLSFLGLGVQPPMSSWGLLIKEGAEAMQEYPWMLFFPAFFLSLTLFSLNFFGDGLRDALDPRVSTD